MWVCVGVCRLCLCLCLCTYLPSLWARSEDSLPVALLSSLSYGVLSGPVRGQGRTGQGVGCGINANKVSGVGCDNAVDGDEAGGKDKVAVVKS